MNMSEIARRLGKYAADNSPAILTGVAVLGTVTTAYLTGKAAFKSAEVFRDHEIWFENELERKMELKDKVSLTWRLYIPAVGTGLLTVVCIIGANRISDRRAAALASAYSLAQQGFAEYRSKVIEKIGATKEDQIRTEVAKEHVEKAVSSGTQVIVTGGGQAWFYDEFSGRLFESDMESVKAAMNKVNYEIINNNYASVNDFYNAVGLPTIKSGDDFGWNSTKLMDIDFHAVMVDNRAVIAVDFRVDPIRGYDKFG